MIFEILSQIQNIINEKNKDYFAKATIYQDKDLNINTSYYDKKMEKINQGDKNNYMKLLNDNKKPDFNNSNIINIDNQKIDLNFIDEHKAKSRFKSDFEVLAKLGIGGGGVVYKVKNNYDTFEYAIKKIKINFSDVKEANRILREVMLLSRLQHNNIVKYLQAWVEADNNEANLEDYDYNYDINEGTKTNLDKVEEIFSNSDVVEKIESDSNIVFERTNKGFDMWNEDENEGENKKNDSESVLIEAYNKGGKHKAKEKKQRYLYIQMEYCEGQTLRETIAKKNLDENSKWDLISQLIDAINYVHENKLIHRDIKPSNIFFDKNNNVKLGDFGLATLSKSKNFIERVNLNIKKDFLIAKGGDLLSCGIGTVYYCSPEQEKGRGYDEKTDMFSLGIVIFELFYSFGSLMHRDIILREIREKHKFPQDFLKNSPENVKNYLIIR